MTPPLITTFRRFPKELFRINASWRIQLRPKTVPGPSPSNTLYDIATTGVEPGEDGQGGGGNLRPEGIFTERVEKPRVEREAKDLRKEYVEPKALDPETYQGKFGFIPLDGSL